MLLEKRWARKIIKRFIVEWEKMIYSSTKNKFNKTWTSFLTEYVLYEHCVKYLRFIYIVEFRSRFVICYINKILHFEITIIFRSEDAHVVLKKRLEFFSEDLKTVIKNVDLFLMNEYQNYRLKITNKKTRYSLNLRKKVFQQLFAYINHYALRKISHQYDLLTKWLTIIKACINVFIIIIKLSCNHKIQKQLYSENDVILLKNVHLHWK